jgi:DNA-binding MarR family transcriptional regulator
MRIQKFLSTSPIFSLHVAHDHLLRELESKLATEEVHFIQALIVTSLFFEAVDVQPSQLASELKTSKSNISHALRDLERRGLVERHLRSNDARAYFFSLTRTGKRKAHQLIKIFDANQRAMEDVGGTALNQGIQRFLQSYNVLKKQQ